MKTARNVSLFTLTFFWHGKHELIHILLGLLWLVVLSTVASFTISGIHIVLAVAGTLAPDLEHLLYLFIRKRNSVYTKTALSYLRKKQIVQLIRYFEKNHKHETYLPFHHIFTPIIFLFVSVVAYQFDNIGALVFMGAGVTHYLFDIVDDLIFLRRLNPNWTRGIHHVTKLRRSQ